MRITDKQMEDVIVKAFRMGQNWAECYVSWYSPSDEDNDKREKECIEACMNTALTGGEDALKERKE